MPPGASAHALLLSLLDGGRVWLAGDASGGRFSAHPRLRRIMWAVVAVNSGADPREGNLPLQSSGGFGGALPGPRQGINRGELFAFTEALRATECRDLNYVTDSAYVQRGCFRLRSKASWRPRSNRDLWRLARELWGARSV